MTGAPEARGGPTRAIAAVSDMLGVPIPTIRSWERRYGFPAPGRTRGRHRRYSTREVDELRALRDAITQGYATKEAVEFVRRGAFLAPARGTRIDDLLRAAMTLDPNAARDLMTEAIDALGVENALVQVVLPAMEEVGSLWKSGVCDAANEHFLTEAVRAWLARLTTLAAPQSRTGPVVLSCGPKDLHTVGLEAFGMLLSRRGCPVVMLGAMTPVNSLRLAVQESGAAAAVVVAQRSVNRRSTVTSIEAIHELLGADAFYAGGAFASQASRRDVPGVYLGSDLIEAAARVAGAGSAR